MSETKKIIRGIKWNYAATAAQMLAQLTFISAVARLLEPEEFGVVAMATVIVRFGNYISGAGIRSYLIQKAKLTAADIRASFVLTGVMGALLCFATMYFASRVAGFFESDSVELIVRVLALSLLISALGIPASALLHRALRFRSIATIETVSYVIAYPCVGLSLAYFDYGAWALVVASLSQQALVLVLSVIACPHPVGLRFGWSEFNEVASTGAHFAMNSILDYCVNAVPTLVVGKSLGEAALGIYDRANRLIQLPTYAVTSAVSRVILPYIAPLQEDLERLRHVYCRSATLSAVMIIPMCMGMVPAARELVLVVLGEKWGDAVGVFRVLTVAMAIHLLVVQLGTCADALRKLTARTTVSIATLAVTGIAMYTLMGYGLAGAAAGVTIGQAGRLCIYAFFFRRWLDFSVKDLLGVYTPAVAVGTCVAVSITVVQNLLGDVPAVLALVSEILVGAGVFVASILLYPHRGFKATLHALIVHFDVIERMPLVASALRLSGLPSRR